MTRIIVLDIDGVLIEPLGYWKALQDTVSYFSQSMGTGDWPPSTDDIRAFEAAGLSSEWDMGAACVALLLVERLLAHAEPELPSEWPQALAFLASRPFPVGRPTYAELAAAAGEAMALDLAPPEAVRAVLDTKLRARAPATPALSRLCEILLTDLHSFFDAPVTRVFQHLAIGSEHIRETYGVEPELESLSYLRQHDRPLLSSTMHERLMAAAGDGWRLGLCTLRPSLGVTGAIGLRQGLSPEAEMAREMARLSDVPLIGRGHMLWLARHERVSLERLVKPFPVQALAAIAAAASSGVADALLEAYRLFRAGERSGPFADPEELEIHVFEDTRNGLAAFEGACQVLRSAGGRVRLQTWGISGGISEKAEALGAAGATVFPDVNQALGCLLVGPEYAEKRWEGG